MTVNIDGMIRAAQQAYGRGDKAEARALLERAIELDEYNESAWLWLSAVVDTTEDQRTCLENVLAINPNNERAKMGLRSMGIDPASVAGGQAGAAAGAGQDAVFTDTSFMQGNEDPFGDADFGAPGGNWDASSASIASSSASVNYQGPQITPDDLDQWVDDLGITGGEQANSAAAQPQADFTTGPFNQPPTNADEDLFEMDEDAAIIDEDAYTQASLYDVVADTDNADADYAALYDLDADDADDDTADYDDPAYSDLRKGDFGNFGESDDDADDYDDSELATADDADDQPQDPAGMFEAIPADIMPGRLPGTSDPAPTGLFIILGLLLILNVGALVFLALRLTGQF
jgi:hypothetical protein